MAHQSDRHTTVDTAFPAWARAPFDVFFGRLDEESRFLHLVIEGLRKITLMPEALEVLGRNPVYRDEQFAARIDRAKKDAEWVHRETSNDYPILFTHSTVAVWSALEVLIEDLAVCWLSNDTGAWRSKALQALKVNVVEYESLSANDRPRYVISELARAGKASFKSGSGRLTPLIEPFELVPAVGSNVVRAIHELSQVRNVLVHCGGIADKQLLDACPWLGIQVGERIRISHSLFGWYAFGVRRYGERLLDRVLVKLGGEGCTCPGMDEIPERPNSAQKSVHPGSQARLESSANTGQGSDSDEQ